MHILIAILLGLIQGLTEFLPVSSSGHLLLLEKAFGLNNPLFFSVMLHLATLAAVCVVLRKELWHMIRHPLSRETLCVVVASAVTAVIYFAFKKIFDAALTDGHLLGYCFLVTAILLFVVEAVVRRRGEKTGRPLKEIKWTDALLIGAFQGFAIFPGISRAGATLSGGLLGGLRRSSAARFSFIISIPVILGSFILEGKDLLEQPALAADINWIALIIGMLVACAAGIFAIRFMLKLLQKWSLRIFGVYVGVLGLFVLLDQWFFHLIAW